MTSLFRLIWLELRRSALSLRMGLALLVGLWAAVQAASLVNEYNSYWGISFNTWDVFFTMFGINFFFSAYLLPLLVIFLLGDTLISDTSSRLNVIIQQRLKWSSTYLVAKVLAAVLTIAALVVSLLGISAITGAVMGIPMGGAHLSEFGLFQDGWCPDLSRPPIGVGYNAFPTGTSLAAALLPLIPYFTFVYSSFLVLILGLTVRSANRYLPAGLAMAALLVQYVTTKATEGGVFNYGTVPMFSDSLHRPYAIAPEHGISSPGAPWSASLTVAAGMLILGIVLLYFNDRTLPRYHRAARKRDRRALSRVVLKRPIAAALVTTVALSSFTLTGCAVDLSPMPELQVPEIVRPDLVTLNAQDKVWASEIASETVSLGLVVLQINDLINGDGAADIDGSGVKLHAISKTALAKIEAIRANPTPPALEPWYRQVYGPALDSLESAMVLLPDGYDTRDLHKLRAGINDLSIAGEYLFEAGTELTEMVTGDTRTEPEPF